VIHSGRVYGGTAYLTDQERTSRVNLSLFNVLLSNNQSRTVTWNVNFSFGPVNKMMTVQQFLYPGEPATNDSVCADNDNIHLYHSSSPALGSIISETTVNDREENLTFSSLVELYRGSNIYSLSLNNLDFVQNNISSINEDVVSINFRSSHHMLELIQAKSEVYFENVELIKIDDRGFNVYKTESVDGDEIVVVEKKVDDEYLYLASSLSLDETIEILNHQLIQVR
jgi:hypothetical protein